MLNLLGWAFYLLAIADFAGMFFGYDFTGQFWTPLLFGGIGQIFFYFASRGKSDGEEE
jgi:hypothetical protein